MIDARHQESVNSHLLDRHIFHMFMSHEMSLREYL